MAASDRAPIRLEGAFNFRDLGGLATRDGRRIRPGLLFRSDTLQALTAADVAILRNDLGLGLIVDLRLADEVAGEGRGPIAAWPDVRHLNAPMAMASIEGVAADAVMPLLYRSCLASDSMVRAIEAVARHAGTPTLFHCAAGKDRTGLVAAMLLSLAGVDDEAIIADYLQSASAMPRIIERFRDWPRYRDHMTRTPPEAYAVEEAAIRLFLDELKRDHGGAWAWAGRRGLSRSDLDAFVATMVA